MNKKKLLIIGVLLFLVGVYLVFKTTYSANSEYMITFNRYERNEILQICKTGADGKIDMNSCYGAVSTNFDHICSSWTDGSSSYSVSNIKNQTFTSNKDFYCVSGTSSTSWTYLAKCFKCGDNYYKWQVGGGGDGTPNEPKYGFPRGDVDSKTCVIIADITDKNKCKAPENACYVCNGEYKWINDPENGCVKQNNITTQENCKEPDKACYVCNGEYKWINDPDESCQLQSEITSQSSCKIENPKTGTHLIRIVWIIGVLTIGYSVLYFMKLKKLNNETKK